MNSNLDRLFKTNKRFEEDGVDFHINDTTSFRVRHFSQSNTRVKAAMAQHYKPFARQIELDTLEQEKQQDITIKMFVDTCLVGWKGVEIDGQPAEFTKEAAIALFKRLPALFDALWKHANDFNNYREDLGNS